MPLRPSLCSNKLVIAAAGSGKTTFLVNEALRLKKNRILITTYTQSNEEEIRRKIRATNKCIPENITVQTWFSFLLHHGARPYQGYLYDKDINGMILVNRQSAPRVPEANTGKYYFSSAGKVYSDKLSKFVYRCNNLAGGEVISRLSRIYSHIFVDEVQDLAGYDLDILNLLLESVINVILVGDPRQVTYLTHHERRLGKYAYGLIKDFIENDCNKDICIIDEDTLNTSHRNNDIICDFSSRLFPLLKAIKSKQKERTLHDGIFLVQSQDVPEYLKQFKPMQLRDSMRTEVNGEFSVMNFGESKGLTFDRVLIYPTKPIINWLECNESELAPMSRSKLYVAITRAKFSVAFVYDNGKGIDGASTYKVQND